MKKIIRVFVVEIIALYAVSQATSGLNFANGIQGLIVAGIVLAVASLLVKPLVNILLLPLNLVTFGLFRWVGNLVVLYGVDRFLQDFSVGAFKFSGFNTNLIKIPAFSADAGFVSYLIFSFLISFVGTFIYWLIG